MEQNKNRPSKEQVKIKEAYATALHELINQYMLSNDTGLLLFTWHLRFLRDSLILNQNLDTEVEPIKTNLVAINTALAEFEAYRRSEDQQVRKFHWNNFCDFLKLNMEEWLTLDDSV